MTKHIWESWKTLELAGTISENRGCQPLECMAKGHCAISFLRDVWRLNCVLKTVQWSGPYRKDTQCSWVQPSQKAGDQSHDLYHLLLSPTTHLPNPQGEPQEEEGLRMFSVAAQQKEEVDSTYLHRPIANSQQNWEASCTVWWYAHFPPNLVPIRPEMGAGPRNIGAVTYFLSFSSSFVHSEKDCKLLPCFPETSH